MQFNLQQAKTNLSKLIRAAENGEEVVIARGSKPVVRLVAVPIVSKNEFKFGSLSFLKGPIPDFLEPMSEEDLQLWEGNGDDDPLAP